MEDSTFQKINIGILAVILILSYFILAKMAIISAGVQQSSNSCPELIDTIYQHCMEEGNISVYTAAGRNAVLTKQYGMCIIK